MFLYIPAKLESIRKVAGDEALHKKKIEDEAKNKENEAQRELKKNEDEAQRELQRKRNSKLMRQMQEVRGEQWIEESQP
jgi:hypothetical protein